MVNMTLPERAPNRAALLSLPSAGRGGAAGMGQTRFRRRSQRMPRMIATMITTAVMSKGAMWNTSLATSEPVRQAKPRKMVCRRPPPAPSCTGWVMLSDPWPMAGALWPSAMGGVMTATISRDRRGVVEDTRARAGRRNRMEVRRGRCAVTRPGAAGVTGAAPRAAVVGELGIRCAVRPASVCWHAGSVELACRPMRARMAAATGAQAATPAPSMRAPGPAADASLRWCPGSGLRDVRVVGGPAGMGLGAWPSRRHGVWPRIRAKVGVCFPGYNQSLKRDLPGIDPYIRRSSERYSRIAAVGYWNVHAPRIAIMCRRF
jgi:hypothetical protein